MNSNNELKQLTVNLIVPTVVHPPTAHSITQVNLQLEATVELIEEAVCARLSHLFINYSDLWLLCLPGVRLG